MKYSFTAFRPDFLFLDNVGNTTFPVLFHACPHFPSPTKLLMLILSVPHYVGLNYTYNMGCIIFPDLFWVFNTTLK